MEDYSTYGLTPSGRATLCFAVALRAEPRWSFSPSIQCLFKLIRKNPPERVNSIWLGMEDYSTYGLTPSGRATLCFAVALRAEPRWSFSPSIQCLFKLIRKNPPERVNSIWLGMEDYSTYGLTPSGRATLCFAVALRAEPRWSSSPSIQCLFKLIRKNPPERVNSIWLGMEDYSTYGLTPSGRATLCFAVALRAEPRWSSSPSIQCLFKLIRKNPPERVNSIWLGMEDSNLH